MAILDRIRLMTDHLPGAQVSGYAAQQAGHMRPGPVRLSKTSIAAFEQCPKKLWFKLHQPHLARFSATTMRLFASGHLVGELARREYRNGILVEQDHHNLLGAVAVTRRLMDRAHPQPVFEAAFYHANVVVRADILLPDGGGRWHLIEVKNSGRVRPAYISDLTTQAWVIGGCGVPLSGMYIRHPVKPLRPWGRSHPVHLTDVELGEEVKAAIAQKAPIVAEALHTGAGFMPGTATGAHCLRPYKCEFFEHCNSI